DHVGSELAGDEDEVVDLEAGLDVPLEVREVVVVDRHLRRQKEIARALAWASEEHQQPAVLVEDLNVVEGRVHGVETALAIDRRPLRSGEVPEVVARLAESRLEVAVSVELHDLEPADVRDVERAFGVERQVGGALKPLRRLPLIADALDRLGALLVE